MLGCDIEAGRSETVLDGLGRLGIDEIFPDYVGSFSRGPRLVWLLFEEG